MAIERGGKCCCMEPKLDPYPVSHDRKPELVAASVSEFDAALDEVIAGELHG